MRVISLLGLVLMAIGVYVLVQGGFTTRKDVVDIGAVKVTADDRHDVPNWAGIAAVVAGGLLVVSGLRKKD